MAKYSHLINKFTAKNDRDIIKDFWEIEFEYFTNCEKSGFCNSSNRMVVQSSPLLQLMPKKIYNAIIIFNFSCGLFFSSDTSKQGD